MDKIKIAFQGEKGAYSHIACEEIYKGAEIINCTTFEETFRTAFEDENTKAIIPLENSLAGRVADIHYLLPNALAFFNAMITDLLNMFLKSNECIFSKAACVVPPFDAIDFIISILFLFCRMILLIHFGRKSCALKTGITILNKTLIFQKTSLFSRLVKSIFLIIDFESI